MDTGITNTQMRTDGHAYYVIGSPDGDGDFIVRVSTISERNALSGKGLCLVTEAYKGDPSVGRGWALYMHIGSVTTTTGLTWIKIAEEESVDGIWGFQQEVLDTLVKKPTFNSHVAANEKEHVEFRKAVDRINALDFHSHSNKSVLSALSDRSGQLYYKNAPVGGGAYVYNKPAGSDGMLVWVNPTNALDTAEGLTSSEVATKFAATGLAYNGQTLQIVEPDGSISSFIIHVNSGERTPNFVGTTGGNLSGTRKTVTFVTGLPVASKLYVGKGYWYLLPPANCGNVAGHIFECVAVGAGYAWSDINLTNRDVVNTGSKITLCYKNKWNKVILSFTDPNDDTTNKVNWKRTYIVRKIGSIPTDKDDGVIVGVGNTRNEFDGTVNLGVRKVFTDTLPLTHDPVYYGVFTETNSGAMYSNSTKYYAEAVFPDWEYIDSALRDKVADKLFSIGDEIVLPKHSTFGDIICKVTNVTSESIKLIATKSIAQLPLDGIEYARKPASGKYANGVKYYQLSDGSVGATAKFTEMSVTVNTDIPEDSGVFTDPINTVAVEYNATTDTYTRHGSNDVSTSNLVMWLSANKSTAEGTNGWFSKANDFDTLANELKIAGFLAGFPIGTATEPEAFPRMINSVGIPSGEELTSVFGDNVPSVWASDSITVACKAATSEGSQNPETLCGVVPMITLKARDL